jgi:hypothetical protein
MTLRIGLWGATRSGKTTFLSALELATFRSSLQYGTWRLDALDPASREFLANATREFMGGTYPSPTQRAVTYRWRISGTPPRADQPWRPAGRRLQFELQIRDVPGRYYDDEYEGGDEGGDESEKLLQYLAACHGLVYLHDPLRRNSGKYLLGTLRQLVAVMSRRGRLNQALPQYLAVCVTKFDHPEVFEPAYREGLIVCDGPSGLPRPKDTRSFFERFSRGVDSRAIAARFAPERTAYYATTALGFPLDRGRFDPAHHLGAEAADGRPRTADDVQPMNVLEPLVWLATRIGPTTGTVVRGGGR